MSKATPILSLDIEAMRIDILTRLYAATKSFYNELANLEILESMLVQQSGQIPSVPKRTTKANAQKVNGQHLPYAEMTQRKAIVEIVAQEPGLEAYEICERLQSGGFRFLSTAPQSSVHTAMRQLIKDGKLQRKMEEGNRRRTAVHHYYAVDYQHPAQPRPRQSSKRGAKASKSIALGISDSVLRVLKKAPAEGFDRGEVHALLDKRFSRQQVTWALNGFIKDGKVQRHIVDQHHPADTRFTLA